jgi:hypothetical protein
LSWPSKVEDGYILVPIPSLLPVSLAMASWSPRKQNKSQER